MSSRILFKVVKFLSPAILLLMRTRLKTIEGSILKKGALVIAAHHEGWQDPFIISLSLKRFVYWVCDTRPMGISLMDAGFYKQSLIRLGAIPIDKENPKRNKFLYAAFTNLISKGEAIVMFPEGNLRTERKDKRLGQAKWGIIKLTRNAQNRLKKQIPIIPIGFEYKKGLIINAHLKIGKPIFIGNKTNQQTLKQVMENIAKLSNIWQE